jgi:Cof subfamily protein (haloacid dehalogenase superfamily)
MAIKLIVTDLDGTFLNSNHVTIPQENIDAFKKAHEMGIKVAVASGRTKILTDYLMPQLPFLDYLITSNGAITYDLKTGEVVCQTLIDNEKSIEIFNTLKNYDLIYEIYYNGDCFMNEESYKGFTPENVAPHIYKLLSNFIKEVPDLQALIGSNGIEKLNILTLTPDQRIEIENKISDVAFASSFPVTAGKNGNLEMTDINATKGFAVKGLADSLGITQNEIMCFGDGENDCSMLQFADFSFAMENGNEYAKKSAKFVTDTNDNGGVAKAIKQYVFGE